MVCVTSGEGREVNFLSLHFNTPFNSCFTKFVTLKTPGIYSKDTSRIIKTIFD